MNKNMQKLPLFKQDNPPFRMTKISFRKNMRVCSEKLPIGFFSEQKLSATPSPSPRIKRRNNYKIGSFNEKLQRNRSGISLRKDTSSTEGQSCHKISSSFSDRYQQENLISGLIKTARSIKILRKQSLKIQQYECRFEKQLDLPPILTPALRYRKD